VSVLLAPYSSIYPSVRALTLVSTRPICFAQSYEYGQLFEIKLKLGRWYWEEHGLRKCAIADNTGISSVSTKLGGEK